MKKTVHSLTEVEEASFRILNDCFDRMKEEIKNGFRNHENYLMQKDLFIISLKLLEGFDSSITMQDYMKANGL